MKIKVTQKYLDQIIGTGYDARSCPLATALNDQQDDEDFKIINLVYPHKTKRMIMTLDKVKTTQYYHGKELREWIHNFDGYKQWITKKRFGAAQELPSWNPPKPIEVEVNHKTNEVEIV